MSFRKLIIIREKSGIPMKKAFDLKAIFILCK